jgi:ribonuclease P/MRP protein subunit RPP1
MIINTSNINEARKEIVTAKKKNEIIIVKAQDEEFNRKILEINDVNILLSPEIHLRKDKLKQRDSGLNEVLCKLASKNNIAIGIDLSELTNKSKKEKAVILSRLKQNISLCKKAKAKIKILNIKEYNKREIASLLLVLGMHNKDIKETLE